MTVMCLEQCMFNTSCYIVIQNTGLPTTPLSLWTGSDAYTRLASQHGECTGRSLVWPKDVTG